MSAPDRTSEQIDCFYLRSKRTQTTLHSEEVKKKTRLRHNFVKGTETKREFKKKRSEAKKGRVMSEGDTESGIKNAQSEAVF